jgi:hypothetical protein
MHTTVWSTCNHVQVHVTAPTGAAEQWRAEAAELQATITQLALNLSAARVAAAGRLAAAVQVGVLVYIVGRAPEQVDTHAIRNSLILDAPYLDLDAVC